MAQYFVNDKAQPTGEHEVHKEGCSYMPGDRNRQPVGSHDNCQAALIAAQAFYSAVDGCFYCCRACHTQ